ncbi:hypothetical protein BZM27_06370 [Paraburkholderia steynii]|uniref:5'-nucleotidase n=1 Tax=Paraburkholderia steynii TaxID=1245441 RepID=A0A4R0XK63_9BURK|nr:hypothetical protein BZM27_06370 [Paraburkholderia steynii]
MAVRHLMRDMPPTLVLSGINRGGNLGVWSCTCGQLAVSMARSRCNLRTCAGVIPGVRHVWRTRARQ